MALTYTLISSVTVGAGGAASIDFTSIPSTYTDLVLKASLRTSRSANTDDLYSRFNASSSTNYSYLDLTGSGSTAASSSGSGSNAQFLSKINAASSTSSTFSNVELYIPNYAGTVNKSLSYDGISENNATEAFASLTAGLRSVTDAITQVSLLPGYNNFVQYTTATLYGIKNS
jgi:hypothetical protein